MVGASTDGTFAYLALVYYIGLAPSFVSCVLLAYAVLRNRTLYPRWFAALNPALLYVLAALFEFVPAPVGGLLVIGSGNLVFLVFFAVSTALLWHEEREKGADPG